MRFSRFRASSLLKYLECLFAEPYKQLGNWFGHDGASIVTTWEPLENLTGNVGILPLRPALGAFYRLKAVSFCVNDALFT